MGGKFPSSQEALACLGSGNLSRPLRPVSANFAVDAPIAGTIESFYRQDPRGRAKFANKTQHSQVGSKFDLADGIAEARPIANQSVPALPRQVLA